MRIFQFLVVTLILFSNDSYKWAPSALSATVVALLAAIFLSDFVKFVGKGAKWLFHSRLEDKGAD